MPNESEMEKLIDEVNDFHKKQRDTVGDLMNENEKYGQNIEVINIHNHFGGTQYYGTDGGGIIGTIGKIGNTIVNNPLLSTVVGFGALYTSGKLLKSGPSMLRLGSTDKKTKIQKEEVKLLESKIAAQNATVYHEKSVFSNNGFTVEFNVEDTDNVVINIFSASDSPIIENYLNKHDLNEVSFNNLPDDDSFATMLKDIVKCKFHQLRFIEKDKTYNLYVNGDLQKSYKVIFEKQEGENKNEDS